MSFRSLKRKILSCAVCLAIIFSLVSSASLSAYAESASATPVYAKVLVNGKNIEFDAYTINSQTYYQIADIALQLAGTSAQFAANWDGGKRAINLVSGAVQSGTMAVKGYTARAATATTAKIYLDGKEIPLAAYTINSHTYYRMKDVADVFGFDAGWDGATGTISLTTNSSVTINGYPIPSYVVNGSVYVVRADLEHYGFEITDDGNVSFSPGITFTPLTVAAGMEKTVAASSAGSGNIWLWDWTQKAGEGGSIGGKGLNTVTLSDGRIAVLFNDLAKIETASYSITGGTLALVLPRKAAQPQYVSNWASVSALQQFPYRNRGLAYATVDMAGKYLNIVTPDGELSIEMKYPKLGDIIADDEGNFYVTWGKDGTVNTDQTVNISKYSPDGVHIKTTGFAGISKMGEDGNTQYPFEANCVSAINGGLLMVNYARGMYLHHQSNNVVGVYISDMSPYMFDNVWNIPYTSHSFNESVIWSTAAEKFIFADLGDAYPRGFVISDLFGTQLLPFHFYLQANAAYNMGIVNKTAAQLGGLAETSRGIALVGASAKSISEAANSEKQNLFVQIFDPNATEVTPEIFTGGTTRSGATSFDINDNSNSPLTPVTDYGVHWLTNYTDTDVIAPQVVATDDDRLVILWSTSSDSFYMILSASGEVLKPATSLNNAQLNSYERPVYYNGTVQWAATTGMAGEISVQTIDVG
jgi:hypothetical protein